MPDHPTAGGVVDAAVDARPDRASGPAPWRADVILASTLTLVLAGVVAVETDPAAPGAAGGPGAYLFAAAFGALVLLRRRAPVWMLVLTVLLVVTVDALGAGPLGTALPAVAALYSAAELGRARAAVGAGVVLVLVSAAAGLVAEPTPGPMVGTLVTDVALVTAAVALGVMVRLTRGAREHAEEVRALTASRQEQAAEQRLQAERLRLARDLHDVVGHHLSVVALHTGVAAEAVGRDADGARTALRHVRDATSATRHELRATVKVLRRPLRAGDLVARVEGAPLRETLPAATGPAGLATLVAPARSAGLTVSTRVDVPAGSIDATVDAAAYRIVQEALANVLRHSGARHVLVRLAVTDGRLRVAVSDDGAGSGAVSGTETGSGAPVGAGIAGMLERATLLGGTLSAADAQDGGFRVVADLPAHLED